MANKIKEIRAHKGFQEKFVRSNVDVVFGGGTMNSGKALTHNELVCTPFGFRRMGDIQVGDTITGSDGRPQKVIATYERGMMDNIELLFSDGRKVQCSRDHLWTARRGWYKSKRERTTGDKNKAWSIWTTDMIIDHLDKKDGHYIHIPKHGAVQFTKAGANRRCEIHPYVLGVLIGDGCLSDKQYSPTFTSNDEEISEYMFHVGYPCKNIYTKNECHTYRLENGPEIVKQLKRNGLWGKLSAEKFIPDSYKYSTIEYRKELLRGLMDTDGTVGDNNDLSYCTISPRLAQDFAWLVRSLGGKAAIAEKQGRYKIDNEWIDCSLAYIVTFAMPKQEECFHLDRKKQKCKDYITPDFRLEGKIVGYKILPQEPMKCITVSNPDGLFLTRDFVVTHNSFGACLMIGEPLLDSNFRAVFLRRTLNETKVGGGLFQEMKGIYSDYILSAKESDNPRITFKSGAQCDFSHIQDESPDKLLERVRGWQYDLIYLDEGTSYQWSTFRLLFSRNRGKAAWTGKMRLTCNPKKSCWIRQFIADYIGEDGYIKPDWDGRIRYFFIKGKNVTDVVWGDTKEEVYQKCKVQIDEVLKQQKAANFTYKDLIKSFTFYLGLTSENVSSIGKNAGYLGSVAAMGEKEYRANLLGNWNVDPEDESEAPIKPESARNVFYNQECRNGDRWITADLADVGKDNSVFLAWDGFHCFDIMILTKATPRMNAEYLQMFAAKHGIPDTHIIFDGTRALYIHDYIPDAIAFISSKSPTGLFARGVRCLKDECYLRLVYVLENRGMSFSPTVGDRRYEHQELRQELSVQVEFEEECSVVRFEQLPNGRKCLMGKRAMNSHLGKSRSMDLLDPTAMRMYPILRYQPGEELEMTAIDSTFEEDSGSRRSTFDIYSETNWC